MSYRLSGLPQILPLFWMSAQVMAEKRPPIPAQNKRETIPKPYCFKFSRGTHCPGCAYKHLCFKCDASHAPTFCSFGPSSKSPLLPTPVKIHRLQFFLSGYNDECYNQIVPGFQFGFPLHFNGNRYPHSSKNLISAHQNPKIKNEIELGRVAGPFSSPLLRNFVCLH